MGAFLGTRGTDSWADNVRPQNWRQGLTFLKPNGMTPLLAITSMGRSKSTTDPQMHWFEKILPGQEATVTGNFTNIDLAGGNVLAEGAATAEGVTLFFKMSEADSKNFRAGHNVSLRDGSTGNDGAGDPEMEVNGYVTQSSQAGASSFIAVKLREADDNSANSDLSNCDTALIIGNANAEHAEMPAPVAYDPNERTTATQIFRDSLAISRTARQTFIRTGDDYKEAKRESLELHGIGIEKAFLWGNYFIGVGDNNQPLRQTRGLIDFIRTYNSANIINWQTATGTGNRYAGQAWASSAGYNWLNEQLELLFRFGEPEKLALCGSGAILGIQELASTVGSIQIKPGEVGFGIKVLTWETPFGVLHLKTHPLMSFTATDRNKMVIFEPSKVMTRFIPGANTKFISDANGANSGSRDGTEEEWLSEIGFSMDFVETAGILLNVGLVNNQEAGA